MADADTEETKPASQPSLVISEIPSALAPFIYFDVASPFGSSEGMVHITLEAVRYLDLGPNNIHRDRVVVGHLRMSVESARSLKRAVDGALLIANPAASEKAN